jgi:hypothetical protein
MSKSQCGAGAPTCILLLVPVHQLAFRCWCRCTNLHFAADATEYDKQNIPAGINQTSSACHVGNLSKDSLKHGLRS